VKTSATARHLKIDRQYPFVECGQHAFLEPATQQHALCRIASLQLSAVRVTSPSRGGSNSNVLQFAQDVHTVRHCP
jgi:hypothetical protein